MKTIEPTRQDITDTRISESAAPTSEAAWTWLGLMPGRMPQIVNYESGAGDDRFPSERDYSTNSNSSAITR